MSPTQTQQHPAAGHIWIACQLQINKQTGAAKMKIQSHKQMLKLYEGDIKTYLNT